MLRLDRWARARVQPYTHLESGDFVKILSTHKHPRLRDLGVLAHTSPQATKPSEARGVFDRHGTVWASEAWQSRDFLMAVRYGIIPWAGNGKEIAWDDRWERYVDKKNRMLPVSPTVGWRDIVTALLKGGHLQPSWFLSRVLMENSFAIPERTWRIL